MKVVQVVPRYSPHTGGVERHVQEVSERLVSRGHDVTVVTGDAGPKVARQEVRSGVSVRRHRAFAPGDAFHLAPGVALTIHDYAPDVVHAHNYHSLPMLLAAIAVDDARLVLTPHYHGRSASGVRDRLLSIYRPLGRRMLRRTDAVIAVSRWERDRIESDFGVSATVIPNGVDIERFRDATPIERDRPYLLTVGRLESYKGIQYAIRALVALPAYELVIAGSGEFNEQLREIAEEADVSNRVTFLGHVPDQELPGLYAGATVYLALSAFEAYGMTVGEALAAGTPCVVRKERGLVDWAERNGCVGITSVEIEAVATAVRTARDRTIREELPTWDSAVESLLPLYEGE